MKKKRIIFVILLIVVLLGVWRGLFELHNSAQEERIAILPIKVWEHLVDAPEYQCWILPLEGYEVRMNVFDDEVDPTHEWKNVKSARCNGISRIGR
jgi:hypothetical protein